MVEMILALTAPLLKLGCNDIHQLKGPGLLLVLMLALVLMVLLLLVMHL